MMITTGRDRGVGVPRSIDNDDFRIRWIELIILLMAASAVMSESRLSFVTPSNRKRTRSPPMTSLGLFSLNLNGDKTKKLASESTDHDVSNEDLSEWVQNLNRWPQIEWNSEERKEAETASSSVSLTNGNSKKTSSNKSINNTFLSPLANLISLKDILLAQGNTIPTVLDDSALTEISAWDNWMNMLKKSVRGVAVAVAKDEPGSSTAISTAELNLVADSKLKNDTSKIELLLSQASAAISPRYLNTVINQARQFLGSQEDLVEEAKKLARSSGLDDRQAAQRANETITYVNNLLTVADTVLRYGFVDRLSTGKLSEDQVTSGVIPRRALFSNNTSAKDIPPAEYGCVVRMGAEMGQLSSAIYEEGRTRHLCFDLGHSIVAKGTTANVRWMVTDSIADDSDFYETGNTHKHLPIHVRTITVRGYDASDEEVDREEILREICTIKPEIWDSNSGVLVHSGLLNIAKAIYDDIKEYIDWSGPSQKIVFNGHSIGGSISIFLMLLLAKERGVKFVRQKVLRVFTFGSPPIFAFANDQYVKSWVNKDIYSCDFLNALGLPSSMVYSYAQPWDPISRLFSELDGLYPLVDDIGEDGTTLFVNGPPRTLRSVVRFLVEGWGDGWVKVRDILVDAGAQKYRSAGIQHLLLPEPIRYLSDRFVSAEVNVPPLEQVIRVSSRDFFPILENNFPLSVFELSLVPTAIRGFLHHFYPAYGPTLWEYAKKSQESRKNRNGKTSKSNKNHQMQKMSSDPANRSVPGQSFNDPELVPLSSSEGSEGITRGDDWGQPSHWLSGAVKQFRGME